MEMGENSVREWVQDLSLHVLYIKGKINPADIFIKEMHEGAHVRCLQDSFMCWLSSFLQQSHLDVHLSHQQDEPVLHQVMTSAAWSASGAMRGSYLSTFCSLLLCNTLLAISHLSSAGRQTMWCSLRVVPSILWDVILGSVCSLRQWFFFSLSPQDAFSSHRIYPGWFFQLIFLDSNMGVLVCPWSASVA